MKKTLLSLLACITLGCGGGSTTVNGQVIPNANSGLRGPLETQANIVSYQDVNNPLTQEGASALMDRLNGFIIRNSSGAAYLQVTVVNAIVSGTRAEYLQDQYPVSLSVINNRLMQECLRLPRQRFTFYFLPDTPTMYLGFSAGAAWLSVPGDPYMMPVAHEFGHMLGFQHSQLGVMSGDDATKQQNWNGWFDDTQLASLGWLTRGLAVSEKR